MARLLAAFLILGCAGGDGDVLRFKKFAIEDRKDMIGGEAVTFLAPVDWVIEGGIVWRMHPTMPATVAARVRDPKSLDQFETFPTLGYSWGGYLGPGTAFPPGANYLGNEVQPPVRDAIAYVKERHLPRVRADVKWKAVREQALPDLAKAAAAAEGASMPGITPKYTAGVVRIEYEIGGKAVEEDLACVLTSVEMAQANMALQLADKLTGMRAEKGKLDARIKVFQTIVNSTRINLEWYNKYAQLCQALTQAQMNQIRAAGELSRYISRTHDEITDMMRQSYEQRQAGQDRINKNWSQYMRGVDEYKDPVAGRPVELPSGYGNAWVNGNGEYMVTDSPGYNPNENLGGNWQKLEKVGE